MSNSEVKQTVLGLGAQFFEKALEYIEVIVLACFFTCRQKGCLLVRCSTSRVMAKSRIKRFGC